ncbi:MAG: hypothetical protein AAGF36_07975 [Pseudomonadota bacterium]
MNTLFLDILNQGGAVSVNQRSAITRGLSQINPDALKQQLQQDLSRRDARAANAVIDVAVAFSAGRGIRLDDGLRPHVERLRAAVDSTCSGQVDAATSGQAATEAEHGTERSTGNGGRPLTFREGVVRLSLTFTTYLIFLAFLLGFRREWRTRRARLEASRPPDPPLETNLS